MEEREGRASEMNESAEMAAEHRSKGLEGEMDDDHLGVQPTAHHYDQDQSSGSLVLDKRPASPVEVSISSSRKRRRLHPPPSSQPPASTHPPSTGGPPASTVFGPSAAAPLVPTASPNPAASNSHPHGSQSPERPLKRKSPEPEVVLSTKTRRRPKKPRVAAAEIESLTSPGFDASVSSPVAVANRTEEHEKVPDVRPRATTATAKYKQGRKEARLGEAARRRQAIFDKNMDTIGRMSDTLIAQQRELDEVIHSPPPGASPLNHLLAIFDKRASHLSRAPFPRSGSFYSYLQQHPDFVDFWVDLARNPYSFDPSTSPFLRLVSSKGVRAGNDDGVGASVDLTEEEEERWKAMLAEEEDAEDELEASKGSGGAETSEGDGESAMDNDLTSSPTATSLSSSSSTLTLYFRALPGNVARARQHVETLLSDFPAYSLTEAAYLSTLDNRPDEDPATRVYVGILGRTELEASDRFEEDVKSAQVFNLVKSFINVNGLKDEPDVYHLELDNADGVWTLDSSLPRSAALRSNPATDLLETLAITCLGPSSLNTAAGGIREPMVPSPQLLAIRDSVLQLDPSTDPRLSSDFARAQAAITRRPVRRSLTTFIPTIPTTASSPESAPHTPRPTVSAAEKATEPDLTAEEGRKLEGETRDALKLRYQLLDDMWTTRGGAGAPIDPRSLEQVASRSAAVKLTDDGYADAVTVLKDITTEDHQNGGVAFWAHTAGGSPYLIRRLLAYARGLDPSLLNGPAVDDIDYEVIAEAFGAVVDLWDVLLRHRDLDIVLVLLVLGLLQFWNAPGCVVRSAKLAQLFVSGILPTLFKKDISPEDWEAVLVHQDLSRLHLIIAIVELPTWHGVPLRNFSEHVGQPVTVELASGHFRNVVFAFDGGASRYDTTSSLPIRNLLFFSTLEGELLRSVGNLLRPADDESSMIAVRKLVEEASRVVGLSAAMEDERASLLELDRAVRSVRAMASEDRAVKRLVAAKVVMSGEKRGWDEVEEGVRADRDCVRGDRFSTAMQNYNDAAEKTEGLPNSPERRRQLARLISRHNQETRRGIRSSLSTVPSPVATTVGSSEWRSWLLSRDENLILARSAFAYGRHHLLHLESDDLIAFAASRAAVGLGLRRPWTSTHSKAEAMLTLNNPHQARVTEGNGVFLFECWDCDEEALGGENGGHRCSERQPSSSLSAASPGSSASHPSTDITLHSTTASSSAPTHSPSSSASRPHSRLSTYRRRRQSTDHHYTCTYANIGRQMLYYPWQVMEVCGGPLPTGWEEERTVEILRRQPRLLDSLSEDERQRLVDWDAVQEQLGSVCFHRGWVRSSGEAAWGGGRGLGEGPAQLGAKGKAATEGQGGDGDGDKVEDEEDDNSLLERWLGHQAFGRLLLFLSSFASPPAFALRPDDSDPSDLEPSLPKFYTTSNTVIAILKHAAEADRAVAAGAPEPISSKLWICGHPHRCHGYSFTSGWDYPHHSKMGDEEAPKKQVDNSHLVAEFSAFLQLPARVILRAHLSTWMFRDGKKDPSHTLFEKKGVRPEVWR